MNKQELLIQAISNVRHVPNDVARKIWKSFSTDGLGYYRKGSLRAILRDSEIKAELLRLSAEASI